MTTTSQRRDAVGELQAQGLSQRHSCRLLRLSRSALRYTAQPDEEALRARLRELAQAHPRYGYRRAWALLRRAGERVNHKRIHRLWRAEGLPLALRQRRQRRGVSAGQGLPPRATQPNQVWAYDFVWDACANGRKLKILTLEDEYTREGLALKVGYNLPAEAVSEVLRQVVAKRGAPGYIRSDNGPEFVARHLQEWLAETGIGTRYIAPGCPWRNGIEESFNGRLRDECLKVEVFYHAPRAQVVLAGWRRHYNEARPHSSLGYLTPLEYRLQYEEGVYKERRTLIFQVALKMGAGQIVTAVIFSLKK